MQEVVPWETYSEHTFVGRRYDSVNPLDTNVEDAEFLTVRTGRHPARYFKGASVNCEYTDSRLERITIHPVDLGFDGPLSDLGIPKQADEQTALVILKSIGEHSKKYGTHVDVSNGIGTIVIDAEAEQ
jgi:hypothetical protein